MPSPKFETNGTDCNPDQLRSRAQALSYLHTLVTSAFSTQPPAGFEFRGKRLYTDAQLLMWLARQVAVAKTKVELNSALGESSRDLAAQTDEADDDDDDDVGDDDGEDDDD